MNSFKLDVLKSYFDENLYRGLYPDVDNSGIDLWQHFIRYGIAERRSFSRIASPNDIESKYDVYTAETITLYLMEVIEVAELQEGGDIEFKKKFGSGHHNCEVCNEIAKHADEKYLNQISLLYKPLDVIAFSCEKLNDHQFNLNGELVVRDYLFMYPDVQMASVNAFYHYYTAGRLEGRKRRMSVGIGKASEFLNTINREKIRMKSFQMISAEFLFERIETIKQSKFYITVSHDNPVESLGGIQQVLLKEFEVILETGNSFIHIFPHVPRAAFDDFGSSDIPINVLLNGELLGTTMMSVFISILNKITIFVEELRIHHLFGLNGHCLNLLSNIPSVTRVYVLHDHSFLCDGYHLLRNDLEYCSAPASTSTKCKFCIHGISRERRSSLLESLSKAGFIFVAPSKSIAAIVAKANLKIGEKIQIVPHWKFREERVFKHAKVKKVNVAYCGFPVYHKGYDLYLDCISSIENSLAANYFLFGAVRPSNLPEGVKFINVKSNYLMSMAFKVELIRRDIHIVILPSRCPESFGFIAHEAAAAGCTVIVSDIPHQPVSSLCGGGEIVVEALANISESLEKTINKIRETGFIRRSLDIEFQHSYLKGCA